MALDERGQIQFDALCHCYDKVLDHLDLIDDAAQEHDGWSAYRVVRQCVDAAAEAFGKSPESSCDTGTACEDFLNRVAGSMALHLPAGSPTQEALAAWRDQICASPATSPADVGRWQVIGENLSRGCYQATLPEDHPNLTRRVKAVSIWPAATRGVLTIPDKGEGESEINLYYAADDFMLDCYVNLPLLFFHEYLSHIHTGPLFGERHQSTKPFEDGWLVYLQQQEYSRALVTGQHEGLSHPLHREYFAGRYFQDCLDTPGGPWVGFGRARARAFEVAVEPDLFRQVTVLVAAHPYQYFAPQIPDVHGDFVRRADHWLTRTATASEAERADMRDSLAQTLEDAEPLRALFDFLVQNEFTVN
ncbi:MAG TPA: hypothetical protein VM537_24660 [Anaerolineae bacterium]|nr:hypothetical protein [Anaerolineae bacterium]